MGNIDGGDAADDDESVPIQAIMDELMGAAGRLREAMLDERTIAAAAKEIEQVSVYVSYVTILRFCCRVVVTIHVSVFEYSLLIYIRIAAASVAHFQSNICD